MAFSSVLQFPRLIIFILAIAIYANTLNHSYTQDDNILIQNNVYTHQGLDGLKGVFTYDTFYGHFQDTEDTASMVAGGRYRPLTHAMFAIEYHFFGARPFWGHLINVLLYAFLCVMIYNLLFLVFCKNFGERPGFGYFVLLATLLYTVHPLHVEAIANIKGRDEIMSMLLAVSTWYTVFKYIDTTKWHYLFSAGVLFFLGFLAKENTITFLAVIPAALYAFRDIKLKSYVMPMLVLGIATALFLYIRFAILGWSLGEESTNVLNNPFLKEAPGNEWVPLSFSERYGTIFFTLGKYLQLFFVPHPLTYDYYPKHIVIKDFSHVSVILSFLIYAVLGLSALFFLKSRTILGFASLYFIATLSIVSNLVFPIGTFMSERFMFMPSLGLTIGIAYLWWQYGYKKPLVPTALIGLWMLLMIGKTVDRNRDWKDNFTLFTTDVKTSVNSAKGNSAAGAQILQRCEIMDKGPERDKLYNRGVQYLQKAQKIVQGNWASTMIEGYLHNQEGYPIKAALAFERAYSMDTTRVDAKNSLAASLRDSAKEIGEKGGDMKDAERYLLAADKLFPNEFETTRLLGVLYTSQKNYNLAVQYFTKYALMKPSDALAHLNLSDALYLQGNRNEAGRIRAIAIQLDPKYANAPYPQGQ